MFVRKNFHSRGRKFMITNIDFKMDFCDYWQFSSLAHTASLFCLSWMAWYSNTSIYKYLVNILQRIVANVLSLSRFVVICKDLRDTYKYNCGSWQMVLHYDWYREAIYIFHKWLITSAIMALFIWNLSRLTWRSCCICLRLCLYYQCYISGKMHIIFRDECTLLNKL